MNADALAKIRSETARRSRCLHSNGINRTIPTTAVGIPTIYVIPRSSRAGNKQLKGTVSTETGEPCRITLRTSMNSESDRKDEQHREQLREDSIVNSITPEATGIRSNLQIML